MKFDKDGKFLASASLAHADGLLPVIHSVVVAPNGEVWVGDRASDQDRGVRQGPQAGARNPGREPDLRLL